jgi:hypothetical protein
MNINYKTSNALQEHKYNLLNPDNIKTNYNIVYQLIEDLSRAPLLGELNAFIPNFFFYLWKQPNILCKLLLSASNKDMKESLSNFFCNNFYENILSPNYIEYNLLYLITLMLKVEITNISDKNSGDPKKYLNLFLNNSSCSFILEQFTKKKDVLTFFKTILLDIIQDLELSCGNKEMLIDLIKIEQEVVNRNKSRKSSTDNLKSPLGVNESVFGGFTPINLDNEFMRNNIFPLNNNYFQKLVDKNKENNTMIGYLSYHMGEIEKKKNIYTPESFAKLNLEDNIYQQSLNEYENNYNRIKGIIKSLFENLTNNLYLLPYSIKCICKIIFSLIKKKLSKLSTFQQYAFISKFFFEKLLNPVFQNPGLGSLINTFIISTTTIKNLELISKIIITFVSGSLFKNNKEEESYTPFNHYLISKMPELLELFEEIINVKLPPFIEKIINDELPDDYEYDFFRENPEEVVFHRSACFTVDDLYLLLELLDKNKKSIFNNNKDPIIKLEKTFDKLFSKKNKELLKKLKNNPEYEIIDVPVYNKKKKEIIEYKKTKGRQIIKYYLISDLSCNKKYSDIFNIKQDTKYFHLPELTNIKDEKEQMENNITKVKNFFCTILYNYRMLVKTDFKEDKTKDTKTLLKEIKKFMKSSNNIIDGSTFPSQWFINSLLDYIDKIPENLIADDYALLINQIQDDVNKAIRSLDLEDLSLLIDKMKFANRGKTYYELAKNLIIDINLNKKAQTIVEKENIEVEILFKYNEESKELSIEPPVKYEKNLQYLDSIFDEPKKKPSKLCKTIKMFTKHFPNLLRYQDYYKVNVLTIEKELKLPQKLERYFKIVQDYIKKNLNITNETEFTHICDKIYDFIMEKLYEKLFPKNMNETDDKINQMCKKLSWVEPKHFIKRKNNFIYQSFLPDLTKYLISIEKEKSIRKKIINMKAIFQCMDNLGKFNGEGKFGLESQIQILNYVFVKAKPSHIWANAQYMELFLGRKKAQIEGQNLASINLICEHVLNITADKLIGVDQKEFDSNCIKSSERNLSNIEITII